MLKPEGGGLKALVFSLLSWSIAPGWALLCKFLLPAPNAWFRRQGQCALWWVLSEDSAKARSWEPGWNPVRWHWRPRR